MTVRMGNIDAGARDAYPTMERRLKGDWFGTTQIQSQNYECGHCGNQIATNVGYHMGNRAETYIAICHFCNRPTFIDGGYRRYPASAPGRPVSGVGAELADLFDEARNAASAGAYTAAVMVCRKMLMNIAVEEGADKDRDYKTYVDYLGSKRLFSPKMGEFVNSIRDLGNEANHQIAPKPEKDALLAIEFVGGLIRYNYELPGKLATRPERAVELAPPPRPARGNGPDPEPA